MIRAEIGSRFAGTPSDTLAQLEEKLATEPLDAYWSPFEQSAPLLRHPDRAPIYPDNPGAVRFRGNFARVSYAFGVDTDEPETIARLRAAIFANDWSPRAGDWRTR